MQIKKLWTVCALKTDFCKVVLEKNIFINCFNLFVSDSAATSTDLDLAQFGSTQRGRPQLVYKGYSYIRNGEFGGTINWRCSAYRNKKCKAKAITIKQGGKEYVTLSCPVHTHDPKRDETVKRKIRRKPLMRSTYLLEDNDDDDIMYIWRKVKIFNPLKICFICTN